MTKPSADITSFWDFNVRRGARMFRDGEPEPTGDDNDEIYLAMWSGYNEAESKNKYEATRRKAQEERLVDIDSDNDHFRYPCDDD